MPTTLPTQPDVRQGIRAARRFCKQLLENVPVPGVLDEQLSSCKLTLSSCVGTSLSVTEASECVSLCRTNMEHIYNAAKFRSVGSQKAGWSDEEKRRELLHSHAYLLLLRLNHSPFTLHGLVHFRLDEEPQGVPVMYLYELQLHETLRGQGVGTQLMGYVEHIAQATKMVKVMCTVQTVNAHALRFYKDRCGYTMDDLSPQNHTPSPQHHAYEILSKRVSDL